LTQAATQRQRPSRLVAALILGGSLLTLVACTSGPEAANPSPSTSATHGPASATPSDSTQYAAQIVRESNRVRHAQGLPALGGSKCAQGAARERASDLIGEAKLTHAPLAGTIMACAPATTAAENLSRAASSPPAVIDAWMNSAGHRSNLLDPALTEIGVGCVLDGKAMLCSQVFLGP
jgi:uncharacterized protein YkwD